jgi:hypothetical protein
MTFVNAGTLGTLEGHRDELVATLTHHNDLLVNSGAASTKSVSPTMHPTPSSLWRCGNPRTRTGARSSTHRYKRKSRPLDRSYLGSSAGSDSTLLDHRCETSSHRQARAVPIADPIRAAAR